MPDSVTAFGIPSYRQSQLAEKCVNKLNLVEESMRSFSTKERQVQNLDPVFDPPLFKASVTRERKRTDRSGLALVMLLIGLHDGRHEEGSEPFCEVAQALSGIKTDT